MDCGTPFCMSGCPLGNIIPEFNDLVRQGSGRTRTTACPRPTTSLKSQAASARVVRGGLRARHSPAADHDQERRMHDHRSGLGTRLRQPLPPQRLTDQTVAVVGSGPSGLACAQQLTRAGHTVVVYERDDAIGGLMRYGIPNFKLDKGLIDRRVEQMEAEGTVFRTSVEIGKDISWDDLRSRYDAVVVAIGSTVPRDMKIPGRELKGIHFAMEFLPDATAASTASSQSTTSPLKASTS